MSAPDPIPALKDHAARTLIDRLDGWSQANAAVMLRTDQPRISDLRGHRLQRFSLAQLIRFASRVGGAVTLQVTWTTRFPWHPVGRPFARPFAPRALSASSPSCDT